VFNIEVGVEGNIDLDKAEVGIESPRCQFYNPVFLKQARLRDVIICRGCKANIQLDDCTDTVSKVRQSVRRALAEFIEAVGRLGRR
jgi:hypothetical protein